MKALAPGFLRLIVLVLAVSLTAACTVIPPGRSAVDRLDLNGSAHVDDSDLKAKLATKGTPKFFGLVRGVVYDYELYDAHVLGYDLARVERYYHARGFYDAHARAGRVITTSDRRVRIEIVIEEGQPVLVKEFHYTMDGSLPPADRAAMLEAQRAILRAGANADEDKLVDVGRNISYVLANLGYGKVHASARAEVDLARHDAAVLIDVHPGEKCVFGKVTIAGLGELPDADVRRVLDLEEGTVFSRRELDRAKQDLLEMGVVGSVEITPMLEGAPDGIIPLTITLEPTKLRTIRVGGGIELDALKTDLHLRARWEDRNFLGGLRNFSVDFTPGVVLYPTRTNDFELPKRLLPEEKLRFEFRRSGFIEARTTGFIRPEVNVFPVLLQTKYDPAASLLGYLEFRNSVGVERSYGKLRAVLSHSLQAEHPFSYSGELNPGVRMLVISYPELTTTLDLRDDRVHPHTGIYLSNNLQVAGLGGQPRDLRIQPEVRAYTPLGSRRFVLAARATVGFLFPFNYDATENARDEQLIFFRGFFSGGPTQNRGYPPRGVGPQGAVAFYDPSIDASLLQKECSETGASDGTCAVPLGGLTLWEASLELRTVITGPVSVVTFCDASDVSAKVASIRFTRPHLSCGIGGRYDTPVGPFRVDIGYRIPGLQALSGRPEYVKNLLGGTDNQGGLPIAIQLGLGEAF